MLQLIRQTSAYNAVKRDLQANSLSHAYLVECADDFLLRHVLISIAKLILCPTDGDFCNECRICNLIEKQKHFDVSIYPKEFGGKLDVAQADEICAESVVKPFELDKRIFIIDGVDKFAKTQNKLLKTLEEPPENVVLLMGTSSLHAVLPTVKSRSKILHVAPFSAEQLTVALSAEFSDADQIKTAVDFADGIYSVARKSCLGGEEQSAYALTLSALENLNTSRDLARVSAMFVKQNVKLILNAFKIAFGNILKVKSGSIAQLNHSPEIENVVQKYTIGAVLEIIEGISNVERALYFNANQQMALDRLLLLVLEAKSKWRKL